MRVETKRRALAAGLVGSAGLIVVVALAWPIQGPIWHRRVAECLDSFAKCRAYPRVRLEGTLVPRSQGHGDSACPFRFRLAEVGLPDGRSIEICLERDFGNPDRQCQDFPEMRPYSGLGVLRLRAVGHFEGNRFHADELDGESCDYKYMLGRFGTPEQIRARRADAGVR